MYKKILLLLLASLPILPATAEPRQNASPQRPFLRPKWINTEPLEALLSLSTNACLCITAATVTSISATYTISYALSADPKPVIVGLGLAATVCYTAVATLYCALYQKYGPKKC